LSGRIDLIKGGLADIGVLNVAEQDGVNTCRNTSICIGAHVRLDRGVHINNRHSISASYGSQLLVGQLEKLASVVHRRLLILLQEPAFQCVSISLRLLRWAAKIIGWQLSNHSLDMAEK
jgi:hypothetical protein